ncbi:GIY-YIG nuclease family protein [Sphingomonas sp. ID0503]|uniref:GIY-YIG nuclease family protein n=1 Tax=Sphingomonas sp. ID0503 TaxID=3399691 RepID=UPI003AFB3ED1
MAHTLPRVKRGYVYIMTNGPSGTLYVGVTSAIAARVAQHRAGEGSEFCRRHRLTRLVHVERYGTITEAIAREKQLKAWQRGWKLNLIGRSNPEWADLYPTLHLD